MQQFIKTIELEKATSIKSIIRLVHISNIKYLGKCKTFSLKTKINSSISQTTI